MLGMPPARRTPAPSGRVGHDIRREEAGQGDARVGGPWNCGAGRAGRGIDRLALLRKERDEIRARVWIGGISSDRFAHEPLVFGRPVDAEHAVDIDETAHPVERRATAGELEPRRMCRMAAA